MYNKEVDKKEGKFVIKNKGGKYKEGATGDKGRRNQNGGDTMEEMAMRRG